MTGDEIEAIWNGMPGGYEGFCKQWGYVQFAQAVIEAAQLKANIPDGWKLVPVEPTKEMIQRACTDHGYPAGDRSVYKRGYQSMLAAAPKPRCDLCDNTGDVHGIDGEWRGECPFCRPTAA